MSANLNKSNNRANVTRKPNRKDINTAARGVSLEHRHFSFIAAALNRADFLYDDNRENWVRLCELFADECRATNPRFDRARFLAACGVED